MTAQKGVNTALTQPGRVFPRLFAHRGDLSPPIWGDKALMGGLMRGGQRPYRGPNFDRLYHKLKVLLM